MLRGDPLNGQLLGIEINLKEAISMTSQLVQANMIVTYLIKIT